MGAPALNRPDSDAYAALLLADTPLIDTRSPLEFAQGALPGAVNLPLMMDDERAQVGLCYKRKGQAAAVELGHSLVSGDVKAARVRAWRDFAERHPDGYLYCFRGGLRSQIAQQWLRDDGCDYPRIIGGYKAVRQFLLEALQKAAERRFLVISGQTGCAKTRLLNQHPHGIDLEGMANHRGSAFGKRLGGQPCQIDFENALAVALLKHAEAMPHLPVLLEDESRLIGRIAVPDVLRASTMQAPLAVVEMALEERVEHTFHNYILGNLADWQAHAGDEPGFGQFAAELHANLATLHRRLGGFRYAQLVSQLDDALSSHQRGNPDLHRNWIRDLLEGYYDPMYAYQLGLKADRVVFRGGYDAVAAFLAGRQ